MTKSFAFLPPAGRAAHAIGVPLAEVVLKRFNTWAFKREQPSSLPGLLRAVEACIARAEPVGFVLYWGKGPRADLAAPDIACLDHLAAMGQRIAAAYSEGVRFTLCLTDTHARLNGHAEGAIDSYFDAVAMAASDRAMQTVRLSELVAAVSWDVATTDEAAHGSADSHDMLSRLGACASKWYRGGDDASEGARRYLAMNMVERLAVERHFPDSIFVTFNGSAYRQLFPQGMPVFYMYSMRRGTSVKPWFVDAAGTPYPGAGPLE